MKPKFLAFISFLVLLLGGRPLYSQTNLPVSGYTLCDWGKIHLMDSSFTSTDTSMVFVTTRNLVTNQGREFLGNEIASDSSLHYYLIYFYGNAWQAVPRKNLASALKGLNGPADYVVYTEGHGKTFPNNVDRGTRLTRLYQVSVVFFDWPSSYPGLKLMGNARHSFHNSHLLGKQYHNFITEFRNYRKDAPGQIAHATLFFHSMGNGILKSVCYRYGAGDLNVADNIIMNAPCVTLRKHKQWVQNVAMNQHLYITYNRHDRILRGASLLFGRRMLGCQLKRHLAPNATYVNFGPLVNQDHNYFIITYLVRNNPGIFNFYDSVFHTRTLDWENPKFFIHSKSGGTYTLR